MMKKIIISLLYIFFLYPFLIGTGLLQAKTLYVVDFTKQTGNAEMWLKKNKFESQKLPTKGFPFQMEFKNNRLYLTNIIANFGSYGQELNLKNAKKIKIYWGIDKFLEEGDNWESKIKRNSLSVTVLFGDKKLPSGSVVVPKLPYYIHIFLSKSAKKNKVYAGKFYKKGGRSICPSCPIKEGEKVITELEFLPILKKEFGLKEVPKISGISFGVNVSKTSVNSVGFIEKIEILD